MLPSPSHDKPAPRPIAEVALIAGRPSLDFVNTIHDRFAVPVEDYLVDRQAFLEWAQRAGVLRPGERRRIGKAPDDARASVGEVRGFREQLHAVFAARVAKRSPPTAALRALDAWVHRAWRDLALRTRGTSLEWTHTALDATLPLLRIALDAVDVLQTVPGTRLKVCAADAECGWLFVDESKNNSRSWCSMNTCGAVWKMRRYRGRGGR